MSGYVDDAYEGWDGREVVYNEKEQKKYESKIWKALAVVFAVGLLATIVITMDNINLYLHGNQVIGIYHKTSNTVVVANEQGREINIYISGGLHGYENGATATLYYFGEDVRAAQELESPWFYLIAYGFFFAGLGLSSYKIFRIYKK